MTPHPSLVARHSRGAAIIATLLALAASVVPARAVDAASNAYPDRPVRLLVGLPPGGGADAVARVLAEGLTRALGQQLLVENRVGAAGLIAADAVAKSAADGYTLLFGTVSSHAIFASLYRTLPYDPVKDFAPVSLIASYPLVLVVDSSLPCRTMAEFVAYAKARPGQLSYASAGNGSPLHLSMEMLKATVGIDVLHVPYKGGVQATGDLLGGRIQVILDVLPTQLANIKSGRVRALAITSAARNEQLPEVQTFAEAGIAAMDLSGWFAVFAPAGVPAPSLRRLHDAIVKVVDDPATRQRLALMGADAAKSTPQQLADFQQSEIAKWRNVVRLSGATAD
jgi:tripartite-type tricarboxylate transporter receptor subunit TctC